ncbi:carboxymuconolactone decarboxylase family protein [Paraburkholderia sp. SIMBA_049]
MSDELMLRGLATRRELSSQRDIDEAFDHPSPCVQQFEEFSTEQYWGGCWSDKTLSHRERSWLSLGMAAATGRHHDFTAALKTALNSGITESELRAAVRQIVVWCGIATGAECVCAAREVLNSGRRAAESSARKRQRTPLTQTDPDSQVPASSQLPYKSELVARVTGQHEDGVRSNSASRL